MDSWAVIDRNDCLYVDEEQLCVPPPSPLSPFEQPTFPLFDEKRGSDGESEGYLCSETCVTPEYRMPYHHVEPFPMSLMVERYVHVFFVDPVTHGIALTREPITIPDLANVTSMMARALYPYSDARTQFVFHAQSGLLAAYMASESYLAQLVTIRGFPRFHHPPQLHLTLTNEDFLVRNRCITTTLRSTFSPTLMKACRRGAFFQHRDTPATFDVIEGGLYILLPLQPRKPGYALPAIGEVTWITFPEEEEGTLCL